MQTVTMTPPCDAGARQQVLLLCVTGDEGRPTEYRLVFEETVIIGSSSQCGLPLSGDGVSVMHCSLRWDEDGIWLQDWGSSRGTFIDAERITTETPVEPGSTIRVGAFTIRLQFEAPAPPQETPIEPQPSVNDKTTASEIFTVPPSEASEVANATTTPTVAKVVPAEAPSIARGLTFLASHERDPAEIQWDSGDQETFDMLRAEVEQLQLELAERDAQLAEVLAADDEGETPADGPSLNQLLERLEDLLGELDRSDERMATLEELLRMSEEAHNAEREERRQLESWLGDIESVFGEREATWDAEMTVLRNHVASLATERDQLLQQMTQPAGDGNSGQDTEETSRLRLQFQHLQQQLQKAEAAETRQEEELRRRELQLAEAAERENVLREEHLKLAEERAALTRLRAEVAAQQAENQTVPPDARNDIDNRVRVFRQHLREIHEEEKQEHGDRSLSSRIGRLWKRIEGR
jgi:hypothetical protein